MDLHVAPGITPKMMAEGHQRDLEVQNEFDCQCITYWLDENLGRAFCLAHAPNKESLRSTHLKAHGVEPLEIIEVTEDLVASFLGRTKDPDTFYTDGNSNLKIFNDPAFRIILVTETDHSRLLELKLGREQSRKLIDYYQSTIGTAIKENDGIKVRGEEFIASFKSVFKAIDCALNIQKEMSEISDLISLKIKLHAGLPVEKDQSLFGEVVNFARFISAAGDTGQIILSPVVRDLYKKEFQELINAEEIKCISPSEEIFLKNLMRVFMENWDDSDFGIAEFCSNLSMSKSQLFRKSKSITGRSTNALLQEYRMQKSLELLHEDDKNISQVAFDCGFSSLSYFTRCFHSRFGIQPTSFLKG